MNRTVEQLIPAIVSYVNEHNGYVTKTKLLKLLYLFDVEFFRTNRRIFTERDAEAYVQGVRRGGVMVFCDRFGKKGGHGC